MIYNYLVATPLRFLDIPPFLDPLRENRVAQPVHFQQTEAMWYTNWALLGY